VSVTGIGVAAYMLVAMTGNPLGELNAALKAEQAGDDRGAATLLLQAAREAPGWTLPKIELAQILLKVGQSQSARQWASDAVRIDPASPRGWHLLSLADEAQGDVPGAEAAEARAASLRPDYFEAKQHLAQLLWNEGKKEPAIQIYVQLVAAKPQDTALLALLATAEEEAGQAVAAEQALRTLTEIQPGSPAWHRRLAHLLEGEGKTADAAEELEKVARLTGDRQKTRRLRPLLPSRR
jgi:predicted Zn-dependent protease